MKKILKALALLCALILVMGTSLLLFSCGEDPCTEHKDTDSDGKCDVCGETVEPEGPSGMLELIKGGEANFKIVVRSGLAANIRMKIESEIINVLSELDVDVEMVDDVASTATECEVLINGATSRGEKYDIDPHYLGAKGYAVKIIDNKVVLLGGSDDSLNDAIKYFVEEMLGISGKTKKLTDVTVTAEMNFEEIQTGYTITSVSVAGNDLKNYAVLVDPKDSKASEIADSVQNLIYEKTGIWLRKAYSLEDSVKRIEIKTVDEACEDGFSVIEKNGNLVIECEFPEKFLDAALGFVRTSITSKKGDVKLTSGLSYSKDVRSIYYKDFGAKGDGKTDDFIAIRNCHNYANKHGHTVRADVGAKYYIGDVPIKLPKGEQNEIIIKTDTDWSGATFIFDDAKIPVQYYHAKHQYKNPLTGTIENVLYTDLVNNAPIPSNAVCTRCLKFIYEDKLGCSNNGGGWHTLSIFKIVSDYEDENITSTLKGATLNVGDTKITLADGTTYVPGKTMLIRIQDESKRQFIRFGVNENNGSAQTEIILVNADGTIDESTPLHWSYPSISYALAKCADDKPITVSGGENGCTILTIANQGPNYYYSYGRNIVVTRSNTLVEGIRHDITGEGLPGKGKCPTSFTRTDFANNVTWKDFILTYQLRHYDASNGSVLGTYEIGASYTNKLTWINCKQQNFFQDDGKVQKHGLFGTNYCKNFYFDDCVLSSFDAHAGVYNVTMKNSTFSLLSTIGEGLMYLENLTFYADQTGALVSLRSDYGSFWRGELYAKNVNIKYSGTPDLTLFSGAWENHYYGYECYMPKKVTLDGLKITTFSYAIKNNERVETVTGTNTKPLYFYKALNSYGFDISSPGAYTTKQNDWKKCTCSETNKPVSGEPHFNDTDGDGRCNNTVISTINAGNRVWCWGFETEPDKFKNVNPYYPTEVIEIKNCANLELRMPVTPQFSNTRITIDGVQTTVDQSTGAVIKKDD